MIEKPNNRLLLILPVFRQEAGWDSRAGTLLY
jgi:hypothetical protein